jgi:hypothetical protein
MIYTRNLRRNQRYYVVFQDLLLFDEINSEKVISRGNVRSDVFHLESDGKMETDLT